MRAYQLTAFGLDNLHLTEFADIEPRDGEALVAIGAVTLNYRDLALVRGQMPLQPMFPLTLGSDFAGTVLSTGAGVTRVAPGDRVSGVYVQGWRDGPPRAEYMPTNLGVPGPGVFRERIVLPAEGLVKVPDALGIEEAAAFPVAALTAWNALGGGGIHLADRWVCIQGTGGVALFALQIAAASGARRVVLTSSAEKAALALSHGAVATIDYREQPEWAAPAVELTGGHGFDGVVDVAGGDQLRRSVGAVAAGGRIGACGFLDDMTTTLPVTKLLMKAVTIAGQRVGSRADHVAVLAFYARHGLHPVLSGGLGFADLAAAFDRLAAGSHSGKIVLPLAG